MIFEIVEKLAKRNESISIMESCTGGSICNEITNVSGASKVFKFGAVTYSNEYKIKFGVDTQKIEKFGVYSLEIAREMSKNIAKFANSDYGVGITGEIECMHGEKDVYIGFYKARLEIFDDINIKVSSQSREKNKAVIRDEVVKIIYKNII